MYNTFDMVQNYINDIIKGLFCDLLCSVYLGNLFMLIGIKIALSVPLYAIIWSHYTTVYPFSH